LASHVEGGAGGWFATGSRSRGADGQALTGPVLRRFLGRALFPVPGDGRCVTSSFFPRGMPASGEMGCLLESKKRVRSLGVGLSLGEQRVDMARAGSRRMPPVRTGPILATQGGRLRAQHKAAAGGRSGVHGPGQDKNLAMRRRKVAQTNEPIRRKTNYFDVTGK